MIQNSALKTGCLSNTRHSKVNLTNVKIGFGDMIPLMSKPIALFEKFEKLFLIKNDFLCEKKFWWKFFFFVKKIVGKKEFLIKKRFG